MVFIKRVLISGFKSYRDQVVFDDFNERVNVIVGKNGSGKSNFFYAIRFVLSDMFTNLRSEDRQRLLHEGSGDTVMSAYVEIVFDNRDQRFPSEKDEVVLRRSIGLKKDEYFLDNKHVTKQDVMNLLETAGFSKSNPYFIVQQGKITALTLMKDHERLDLLKEVAGTRVYEERREESTKILIDADAKRESINSTLTYIEERLSELEAEKEELKEYQQVDRERRALEYTIYDKELSQAMEALKTIDESRVEESDKAGNIHKRALEIRDGVRKREREIKNYATEMLQIKKEKSQVNEERAELIKERSRLELEAKDAQAKIQRGKTARGKLEKDKKTLEEDIEKQRADLDGKVGPAFEKAKEKERKINETLAERNRRVQELYQKQGRSSQFKSKKERDDFLKKETAQINQQIKSKNDQISALQKEIKATEKVIEDNITDTKATADQLDERKQLVEAESTKLIEEKRKRDELSNNRKDLWKRDAEMDSNIQNYKNELLKNERQLQSTVNKVISSGLQAVRRITTELKIAGVYGPIIELFEVPDSFMTAVEVTAGNALFHVVVDTDETAAAILEEMNKEKVGRVTFIPLNQLNIRPTEMPADDQAITPMISKLQFKPMYKKAFQQIFGKTLVCRDIEVATQYSRTHNLDCITLDGDQVSRKGALTGGYYDARTSRLEAMKNIRECRAKLDSVREEATKIKKLVQETDQQISNVLGSIQATEANRNNVRELYENDVQQYNNLKKEDQTYNEILHQKQQNRATLLMTLKNLEETVKSMQAEIGTDLLASLSPKEQTELGTLTEEITGLQKEVITASATRSDLEGKKTELDNSLTNNLEKRLRELSTELDRADLDEKALEVESKKRELESAKASVDVAAARIAELDDTIEDRQTKTSKLNSEIDELRNQEKTNAKQLQAEYESMEKLLNKRSLLLQKREDCERKIREIGSLPTAEVEAFKDNSLKQLMATLHTANTKLKGYSHVNKKALEQYMSFSDQRDNLLTKKKELDDGAQSIAELIDVLDQKKDDAIGRTVRQVAKHFQEVFKKLVPNGTASLTLMRPDNAGAETQENTGVTISQCTAIGIKASFSGAVSDTHKMQQLSGGQKSVVALALIFAIQLCDPAPFYLFDEIDSALDTTYRSAVADMIRAQSKSDSGAKTQFICSTFRPEIVQKAHKFYEVSYNNKESSIGPIEKDEALTIIAEEMGVQNPEQE